MAVLKRLQSGLADEIMFELQRRVSPEDSAEAVLAVVESVLNEKGVNELPRGTTLKRWQAEVERLRADRAQAEAARLQASLRAGDLDRENAGLREAVRAAHAALKGAEQYLRDRYGLPETP